MPDYLHRNSEFSDLIRTVGQNQGIHPYLVAKDYWMMHILYGLKKSGYSFQLKGGTSLSKGYGLIHRFSEDIDIRIEPAPELKVQTNIKRDKDVDCESRKKFYDLLAEEIKIDGIQSVERDTGFDDEKYRSGGIRLNYSYDGDAIEGVKPGVLLEVGFDIVTPNKPVDINSWALMFAQENSLDVINNTAVGVQCYAPTYTFVEKLQTILKKHKQQQSGGKLPENFIRHYYDVMCLLNNVEVQAFIGTEAYHKHKEERFRGEIRAIDLSKAQAFLLDDKPTRDLYVSEYTKTQNLYYKGQPSFEEILKCIRNNLSKL